MAFGLHQLSSVQSLSCVQLFAAPWTAAHQASLSFTISQTWSNSCPLSWWCHPSISSSVIPFSSCLQSSAASWSFPVSQFFTSGGLQHQLQLQHQSFQWIFRTEFPQDWLVWSPCCPRDYQESSSAAQFKSINSSVLCLLYVPTLTSVHDYWKNQ